MFKHLREVWTEFKSSQPGRRFQEVRKRRDEIGNTRGGTGLRRVLWIGAGLLLMAVGVVFLAIPGPGTVVLFVGVALVARESLWVARGLDRVELALRPSFLRVRRWWRRITPTQRTVLTVTASLLTFLTTAAFYFYARR